MEIRELLLATAQNAVALFIIIDAVGVLPIFAAVVCDLDDRERRRAVNQGVLVASLILLVFATLGRPVLHLFAVGLPELMIAGGVMLLIIGLDEIFGFMSHSKTYRENVGIVPLACPLIAGPGAIVTTMLIIQRNPFPSNYIIALLSIALALGGTWVVLYFMRPLMNILGTRGTLILAKLMGVLVTAIGTHFILQGLVDFWGKVG
ncbi:MAG: MarC family protein [Armatimonadota bacterium]